MERNPSPYGADGFGRFMSELETPARRSPESKTGKLVEAQWITILVFGLAFLALMGVAIWYLSEINNQEDPQVTVETTPQVATFARAAKTAIDQIKKAGKGKEAVAVAGRPKKSLPTEPTLMGRPRKSLPTEPTLASQETSSCQGARPKSATKATQPKLARTRAGQQGEEDVVSSLLEASGAREEPVEDVQEHFVRASFGGRTSSSPFTGGQDDISGPRTPDLQERAGANATLPTPQEMELTHGSVVQQAFARMRASAGQEFGSMETENPDGVGASFNPAAVPGAQDGLYSSMVAVTGNTLSQAEQLFPNPNGKIDERDVNGNLLPSMAALRHIRDNGSRAPGSLMAKIHDGRGGSRRVGGNMHRLDGQSLYQIQNGLYQHLKQNTDTFVQAMATGDFSAVGRFMPHGLPS